jgi:hypothetical protein
MAAHKNGLSRSGVIFKLVYASQEIVAVFILKLFIYAPVPSVKTALAARNSYFVIYWEYYYDIGKGKFFLLNMFLKGLLHS